RISILLVVVTFDLSPVLRPCMTETILLAELLVGQGPHSFAKKTAYESSLLLHFTRLLFRSTFPCTAPLHDGNNFVGGAVGRPGRSEERRVGEECKVLHLSPCRAVVTIDFSPFLRLTMLVELLLVGQLKRQVASEVWSYMSCI